MSCRRSLYLLKNNARALHGLAAERPCRLEAQAGLPRRLLAPPARGERSTTSCSSARRAPARADGGGRRETGRTRWTKPLPSRAESSPLLASGRLYFGTEDGTVYALRARDGAVRWRAKAAGAVKGGLALDDGRLIFGDYGGKVHAVRRSDGKRAVGVLERGERARPARRALLRDARRRLRARVRRQPGRLRLLVLARATGGSAWRHKTGGFVYSSPAVATVPGVGPTVYVGSFDNHLYAFDARSGDVRWRHDAGGRISGGPAVFGDLVLFSNLGKKSTTALGAATGKRVWATGRGAFNPAISDGRRIYLNGYSSLFMLSSRRQARIDERARRRLGRAADTPSRRAERRAAARARSRQRAIDRRVAARRAAVRRTNRLRRAGGRLCFTRDGERVCRVPGRSCASSAARATSGGPSPRAAALGGCSARCVDAGRSADGREEDGPPEGSAYRRRTVPSVRFGHRGTSGPSTAQRATVFENATRSTFGRVCLLPHRRPRPPPPPPPVPAGASSRTPATPAGAGRPAGPPEGPEQRRREPPRGRRRPDRDRRLRGPGGRGSGTRLGRSSRTGFSSKPRDSAPKRSASRAKRPKADGRPEDREAPPPRPGRYAARAGASTACGPPTPAAARCALASADPVPREVKDRRAERRVGARLQARRRDGRARPRRPRR